MEKQGWLSEFWDNPIFIFFRFLIVLVVVCVAEFYVLRHTETAAPVPLSWCFIGVTVIVWIIVMCICRGGTKSDTVVMMRLLRRYRRGGILQAEDKHAVHYWQSIGYMRTGFTDETPNKEAVDTAGFTPEGLELFLHEKFETQLGVWPSFKRFFVGLANAS